MRNSLLPILFMSSYASQYGCGGSEAVHVCHDCPDGRIREFARVRSGALVRKSYLATLLTNPTSLQLWKNGIASGDIIILPETSGSYDPGEPKELKGYGDRKSSYGPRTMKLSIADPDYADNYAFYNEISTRTDLVPVFRTSSLIHIFDKTASIKAKDPVADDLEEEIVWLVECEVVSENLPQIHKSANIESVFSCATF